MLPSLTQTLEILPAWLGGPRSEQELRASLGGNFSSRFVDRGCSLLSEEPMPEYDTSIEPADPGTSFFLTATGKLVAILPTTRKKRR